MSKSTTKRKLLPTESTIESTIEPPTNLEVVISLILARRGFYISNKDRPPPLTDALAEGVKKHFEKLMKRQWHYQCRSNLEFNVDIPGYYLHKELKRWVGNKVYSINDELETVKERHKGMQIILSKCTDMTDIEIQEKYKPLAIYQAKGDLFPGV